MDSKLLAGGLFWFTSWTVISFMAHYFAKESFSQASTFSLPKQLWFLASILTFIQLLTGSAVLFVSLRIPAFRKYFFIEQPTSPSSNSTQTDVESEFKPSLSSLVFSHLTATMFTNASLAFGNAGSAFTIKAFEPITTALLTSLLVGIRQDATVIISLPLVVSGSIGFVYQPNLKSAGFLSLGLAFSSNILYGIRNINIKQMQSSSNIAGHSNMAGNSNMLAKLQMLYQMSIYSMVILIFPVIFLGLTAEISVNFFLCTYSGLCHITYTIISTCLILKYTSVVGHATCNLLKRLLVAVAFFALNHRAISSTNWVMLGLLGAGLVIYMFPNLIDKRGYINSSLSLAISVSIIVILSGMLSHNSHKLPSCSLPPVALINMSSSHDPYPGSILAQADCDFIENVKIYENPSIANRISNKMATTEDLVQEAYRLHGQIFSHIMKGYKRAILVNVFQWFNKGDHLITIGQRKIMERMGLTLIYHCYYPGRTCDYTNLPRDDDVIVLVQGAGYIGHPAHKFVMDNTMKHFPNNRFMVFPISVCHPTEPCNQIVEFANIFAQHKDCHIVFRDKYSYELGTKYFRNVHNYMAPDSAFAVGNIRLNIVPVYDIIWLKRNDWEMQTDPMPQFPNDVKVQVTDWIEDWMKTVSQDFWEDHQLRTMSGVAFLARGKVIVSDRLHAHLMSQLMGKPNVAINSKTKKQEHYFLTWETNVKNSVLVNSNAEALAAALRLLQEID